MYVQDIVNIKDKLVQLKSEGLVSAWELPYENLLTRLSAAIFFVTPADDEKAGRVWELLGEHSNFSFRENKEGKLSALKYRVVFNEEEKKKAEAAAA